eukprot:CAMPEP_0172576238 /NCGR_PEP_ID=MMETSP1067-20121228/137620_1 /TAXON_ID=265564 ORGANISM="Thalassiosira punctigera, Strain Tpunct2005C2" /NCGR_SAMPLE_ID=MMETSP1067 /ASSEMBLY_ACC=CAM_ASM_000444 /LENGTH=469 /DNA_ID=CAMNT_0013368901 /DNA_START=225 /DNA_END=1634 /DNA_ORIENTATION=+
MTASIKLSDNEPSKAVNEHSFEKNETRDNENFSTRCYDYDFINRDADLGLGKECDNRIMPTPGNGNTTDALRVFDSTSVSEPSNRKKLYLEDSIPHQLSIQTEPELWTEPILSEEQHAHEHVTARSVQSRRSLPLSLENLIPVKDNMTYWSALSVRVAVAVVQAKGSERMARKAAKTILNVRQNARKKDISTLSLYEISKEVSVALLKAGGDKEVVVAVTISIMSDHDGMSLGTTSSTSGMKSKVGNDIPSLAQSTSFASTIMSAISFPTSMISSIKNPSATPSMAMKRKKNKEKERKITPREDSMENVEQMNLKTTMAVINTKMEEKEKEIAQKQKALEDAEQFKLQKKMTAIRTKLKEKEKEIAQREKALEDAEQSKLQKTMAMIHKKMKEKEKEIAQREKALQDAEQLNIKKKRALEDAEWSYQQWEKEIHERLVAVDEAEAALMESTDIERLYQSRAMLKCLFLS